MADVFDQYISVKTYSKFPIFRNHLKKYKTNTKTELRLLFHVICHEAIVLPTSLFNFEFYASNYVSVFPSEYQSNLGTMPTTLT